MRRRTRGALACSLRSRADGAVFRASATRYLLGFQLAGTRGTSPPPGLTFGLLLPGAFRCAESQARLAIVMIGAVTAALPRQSVSNIARASVTTFDARAKQQLRTARPRCPLLGRRRRDSLSRRSLRVACRTVSRPLHASSADGEPGILAASSARSRTDSCWCSSASTRGAAAGGMRRRGRSSPGRRKRPPCPTPSPMRGHQRAHGEYPQVNARSASLSLTSDGLTLRGRCKRVGGTRHS